MINTQQSPVVQQCMTLSFHIILRGDLETSCLVPFLRVVHDEDVDYESCPVMLLSAEHKSATFVGEGVQRVFDQQLSDPWFDDDHASNFLVISLYLSALSGRTVTIIPSSRRRATRIAPARLAAELGLSSNPSFSHASRIRACASSVLTSSFSSATSGS